MSNCVALVEEADIGLQSDQAAFAEPPEHGIFEMSCLHITLHPNDPFNDWFETLKR